MAVRRRRITNAPKKMRWHVPISTNERCSAAMLTVHLFYLLLWSRVFPQLFILRHLSSRSMRCSTKNLPCGAGVPVGRNTCRRSSHSLPLLAPKSSFLTITWRPSLFAVRHPQIHHFFFSLSDIHYSRKVRLIHTKCMTLAPSWGVLLSADELWWSSAEGVWFGLK